MSWVSTVLPNTDGFSSGATIVLGQLYNVNKWPAKENESDRQGRHFPLATSQQTKVRALREAYLDNRSIDGWSYINVGHVKFGGQMDPQFIVPNTSSTVIVAFKNTQFLMNK